MKKLIQKFILWAATKAGLIVRDITIIPPSAPVIKEDKYEITPLFASTKIYKGTADNYVKNEVPQILKNELIETLSLLDAIEFSRRIDTSDGNSIQTAKLYVLVPKFKN